MNSLMGIEAYFIEMVDKFISSSQPIEEFFKEQQVSEPVRPELRELFRLALLRREVGKTSRGTAPNRDFLLRLGAIERITYPQ